MRYPIFTFINSEADENLKRLKYLEICISSFLKTNDKSKFNWIVGVNADYLVKPIKQIFEKYQMEYGYNFYNSGYFKGVYLSRVLNLL
jgi:hypothetical protein